MYGDLSDPNQVREAMKGIEIVYHVGAAMDGGWDVHRTSTGTGDAKYSRRSQGNKTETHRIFQFPRRV